MKFFIDLMQHAPTLLDALRQHPHASDLSTGQQVIMFKEDCSFLLDALSEYWDMEFKGRDRPLR